MKRGVTKRKLIERYNRKAGLREKEAEEGGSLRKKGRKRKKEEMVR